MIPAGLVTSETLELAKQAQLTKGVPTGPGLSKSGISLAEGLTGYNLEAPAKKLFPVYAPLRNKIARVKAPVGATAVNWKRVTGINTANVWPGVAENTRQSVFMTTSTDSKSATFKTLGFDDYVGFEAIAASKGFEDVRAMAALNLLYAVMIGEEKVLLGGNVDAVAAPTLTSETGAATGGALSDGTYKIKLSSLVLRGYDKGSTGNGGADADGESAGSAASTGVVLSAGTAVQKITYIWGAKKGAVAYNGFVQKDAGSYYYQWTSTATKKIWTTAFVGSGNVPNTGDATASALEFDGIISQLEKNANASLFVDQGGVTLTSDGSGGITEFETMLRNMWELYKLGPTMILCNSQEAASITKLIGSDTGLQHTIYLQDGQKDIVGGIFVGSYLNKFSSSFAEGIPNNVPIKIHPNLPPGTILFLVETLPYPNNQVPNVWEVETNQEYTQYEWALSQRRYEFGIYVIEVLKGYFPVAQGAIVGVGV